MKEQDAAHFFEKEDDDIRGHHEPDDRPQSMIDLAEKIKLEEQLKLSELTRLRSELQQKDEIIKWMLPIVERHVYLHGNDDSVVDRKSIIAQAKELLKSKAK